MLMTLNPIIRTVMNMMNSFGGTSILTVSTGENYDYETSTTVETSVDYEVQTISFDYLQKGDGFATQMNSLIQSGDKQMFIRPKAGVPFPSAGSDHITYQGKKFRIVTVKDINPSGNLSVLWEAYIRA